MARILEKLALHRPELRAWAMYDWANSAFITIVVTAVFPIFYSKFANHGVDPDRATMRLALINTIAVAIIAVLAPILGTLADLRPAKKRLLGGFAAMGASATAGMALIGQGQVLFASVLFVIAFVGASGSFVFYDALLPHVAKTEEVDRLSTAGYALGYLGGGMLLAAVLLMVQKPTLFGLADATSATKVAFVMTGLWWGAFTLPLLRRVREPDVKREPSTSNAILESIARLRKTAREFKRYRHAVFFMLAFLIYNDGIGTIIKMAVIFGQNELGLATGDLLAAILLVQFVGVPCAFAFGQLSRWISAKNAILSGLVVYCGVCVFAFFMTATWHFYALALIVGSVQGGVQGLSRSLFATLIPKDKSGEFFGFFAVFERFASVIGPLLFALVIAAGGSSRLAILALIAFFVIGGVMLWRLDVDAGQHAAEQEVSPAKPELS